MASNSQSKNPEKQSRNEYIPHYIAKKPFYLQDEDGESDYLEHQRLQNKQEEIPSAQKWLHRERKTGPAATKYCKGACENCGAMTHKLKDCLSRKRKVGARWNGKDIQADEIVQDVQMTWDGKRDRWNGYDAREHTKVVQEHARMEELRKLQSGVDLDEEDEDKYAEESEMPGQTYDAANRISTRNLRIREDTAKYLVNLDLDSARYDPKTRTMVDKGATSDAAAVMVTEENVVRSSGDAAEFEKMQKMAWESQERGDKSKLHLQANPTEAEHLKKKQAEEAEAKRAAQRKMLLDKYGGAEHLDVKPPVLEEEERYVEYTETGQIKGKEQTKPKSKYVEDKYNNNHTSVWGSWWENFKWGYACCHSSIKNSYCTGEEGIKASEDARKMRLGLLGPREVKHPEEREKPKQITDGTEVVVEEEKIEDEKKTDLIGSKDVAAKRKLQHMLGGVTEEEMENYKKQQRRHDDPMANFVDAV